MQFLRTILSVWLVLVIASCGVLNGHRYRDHRSTSGELPVERVKVIYHESVPAWQQGLLRKDLEILSDAGLKDPVSDTEVLGISDFSNESLRGWLGARYQYLVGELFDYEAKLAIERRDVSYDVMVASRMAPLSLSTIMTNLGSAVYLEGRKKKNLYSLTVAGNKVVLNSPRVGVLQVGEGLFNVNKVPGSDKGDDVNSYFRLSTLFHEGRHGDGNGSQAGFLHVKCPSGDYVGEYACDTSTNGPYSVGKVILSKFRDGCSWCSKKERVALDLQVADLTSRVLEDASWRDPRFERINP